MPSISYRSDGIEWVKFGKLAPIGYLSIDRDIQDLRPSMAYAVNGNIERRYWIEKYKEGDKPALTSETSVLSGTWYKAFLTGVKEGDNFFISPEKRDQLKLETREGIVAGIRIVK